MEITDVRIKIVSKGDNAKLKACASVTFDQCFVVHNVRLVHNEGKEFIAMPCNKTPEGKYVDIAHPLNAETREKLQKAVIEAYEKALKEEAEIESVMAAAK